MDADEKTTSRFRGTTLGIQQVARAMREEMMPAEQRLWQALKGRQLNGLRFRAQHPVGQFVLDFYCSICKLAVELDGDSHDQRVEEDEARTQRLNAYGYQVIRFRNEEVMADLPGVLDKIRRAAVLRSCSPVIGG